MKIGKVLASGNVEKEYIQLGGCFGEIYKDSEAFNNKLDVICYMPELTDSNNIEEGYKYKDFINLAKAYFRELGVVGEPEVLAKLLFDSCEWQHPETLLDEWNDYDEF